MLSLTVLVRTLQYMYRNKNRGTMSLYRSLERIERDHLAGVGARVKIGFIGEKKKTSVDVCWEGGGKATSVKGSDMERFYTAICTTKVDR